MFCNAFSSFAIASSYRESSIKIEPCKLKGSAINILFFFFLEKENELKNYYMYKKYPSTILTDHFCQVK